MGTLRLTQTSPGPGRHRVQLDLDGEGLPRSAVAEFAFAVGAADTRCHVARALAQRGRLGDGLLWAQAALRDYQSYGDRAAAKIAQIQQLIAAIEQVLAGGQA